MLSVSVASGSPEMPRRMRTVSGMSLAPILSPYQPLEAGSVAEGGLLCSDPWESRLRACPAPKLSRLLMHRWLMQGAAPASAQPSLVRVPTRRLTSAGPLVS